jgi:hypothetical protein
MGTAMRRLQRGIGSNGLRGRSTALMRAAQNGRAREVELRIAGGADADAQDTDGSAPAPSATGRWMY